MHIWSIHLKNFPKFYSIFSFQFSVFINFKLIPMSDLAKGLIGVFIWSLLTIGSYNFSKVRLCASLPFGKHNHSLPAKPTPAAPVTTVPEEPEAELRLPLDFRNSDATPLFNAGYSTFKSNILTNKTKDNILEITGYYLVDEKNTSTYVNLGLARANEVKNLFLQDMPAERIRVIGAISPNDEDLKEDYVEGVAFKWLDKPKSTVEVFADRTVIRFPFNSVQKITDPVIDDYLNKLAKKIIATKEKVSLTGHTDNVGESEINAQLALRRAKMIRDLLLKKGVNRNQINTYSKGENAPIAENDTEIGRQQNRRVVVRLIKKNS